MGLGYYETTREPPTATADYCSLQTLLHHISIHEITPSTITPRDANASMHMQAHVHVLVLSSTVPRGSPKEITTFK